ncbi:TetR family transcriptional regulator [Microbacterium sp. NIBRBAC000506063]|nr:TetR family transcriptional regulator [Microbacterium sp. NIBRBAC000506063]
MRALRPTARSPSRSSARRSGSRHRSSSWPSPPTTRTAGAPPGRTDAGKARYLVPPDDLLRCSGRCAGDLRRRPPPDRLRTHAFLAEGLTDHRQQWKTVNVTTDTTSPRRGRPGYDRAEVLRAAVAQFNAQGYEATSVSELTSSLGLTKSALYHHFRSKEEILEVALETALSGLEGVLSDAEEAGGTASDRLTAVILGAVEVLVAELPSVTLLLRLRGNSQVELAALERRRSFDHRVTALVRAAQEDGALRDDVDAAVATRLIFGMINSLTEWYRPEGRVDAGLVAQDVLMVALEGLRRR